MSSLLAISKESKGQMGLAFAHLNLRHNPFGEPSLEDRASLAVVDLEAHLPRLAEPGFALQLLGACGRGKSTHLHAIRRHFPRAVYVYVGEEGCPAFPRGHPFLLDEAQRVPARKRRRLFRRAKVSFALGSHEDLTEELGEANLTVVTLRPDRMLDAERLGQAIRRRIEWARRGRGLPPAVPRRTIDALLKRYGTDVRAMERWLYDAFQRLEKIEDVEM